MSMLVLSSQRAIKIDVTVASSAGITYRLQVYGSCMMAYHSLLYGLLVESVASGFEGVAFLVQKNKQVSVTVCQSGLLRVSADLLPEGEFRWLAFAGGKGVGEGSGRITLGGGAPPSSNTGVQNTNVGNELRQASLFSGGAA